MASTAEPYNRFADDLLAFDGFGTRTITHEQHGIPYFINEFWTSGQRRAHNIHEISYRACFKPQLPGFFIEHLTQPGALVYDPFMGRGTTPVQAALMGRRVAGNDVNPLSVLLTRPRLNTPSIDVVASRLDAVDWADCGEPREDLLAFYSPATLRQIAALRHWMLQRAPIGTMPDAADDWIRMVALNRLTGHSPGFFSVYTLPPNQATSVTAQRKINAKRGQTPPDRDVRAIILKKSRALLKDGGVSTPTAPVLLTAPADATPDLPDHSIDLVVTSPPFLDVVQYSADNWLRSWFAGIDADAVEISCHRSQPSWQDMVRRTLTELARVVKPGGHVAFEVGEVHGGQVLLERLVWEAADGLPFERRFVVVNQQIFTKTANCWGVDNNTRGTNTNRIVILRRR